MSAAPLTLYLIRHGETAWSKSGRHTGLTDIPLTKEGIEAAKRLGPYLKSFAFDAVYTSPLERAKRTCELAGFLECAVETDALLEWNYGEYEGKTSHEIKKGDPNWNIFTSGAPGGESIADIQNRTSTFLDTLIAKGGSIALFSSGHILRAIAGEFLNRDIALGKHLLLSTATLSILTFDRGIPVIECWNTKGDAL